jgi:hypothetical protein
MNQLGYDDLRELEARLKNDGLEVSFSTTPSSSTSRPQAPGVGSNVVETSKAK